MTTPAEDFAAVLAALDRNPAAETEEAPPAPVSRTPRADHSQGARGTPVSSAALDVHHFVDWATEPSYSDGRGNWRPFHE